MCRLRREYFKGHLTQKRNAISLSLSPSLSLSLSLLCLHFLSTSGCGGGNCVTSAGKVIFLYYTLLVMCLSLLCAREDASEREGEKRGCKRRYCTGFVEGERERDDLSFPVV